MYVSHLVKQHNKTGAIVSKNLMHLMQAVNLALFKEYSEELQQIKTAQKHLTFWLLFVISSKKNEMCSFCE